MKLILFLKSDSKFLRLALSFVNVSRLVAPSGGMLLEAMTMRLQVPVNKYLLIEAEIEKPVFGNNSWNCFLCLRQIQVGFFELKPMPFPTTYTKVAIPDASPDVEALKAALAAKA